MDDIENNDASNPLESPDSRGPDTQIEPPVLEAQDPAITPEDEEEEEELFTRSSGSAMNSGPGKIIAFGVIMLVVVGFILYSLFFNKPQVVDSNNLIAASGLDVASTQLPMPAAP